MDPARIVADHLIWESIRAECAEAAANEPLLAGAAFVATGCLPPNPKQATWPRPRSLQRDVCLRTQSGPRSPGRRVGLNKGHRPQRRNR